jgi:hypothetical protein
VLAAESSILPSRCGRVCGLELGRDSCPFDFEQGGVPAVLVERIVFWGGVYLDLHRAFGPRTADGGCPHMGSMNFLQ